MNGEITKGILENEKKYKKMKAIDNQELILALEELEKEKGIKKEVLLESIKQH